MLILQVDVSEEDFLIFNEFDIYLYILFDKYFLYIVIAAF